MDAAPVTAHSPSHAPMGVPTPDPEEPPHNPWQGLARKDAFFENEEIAGLMQRALFYARAGIPIHFQGAAGEGKTSLAFAIARRLGRPVAVMVGNDWMDAADLIGKEVGQSSSAIVDKYVQSVRRTETQTRIDWQDSILARAMEHGQTLVYDEFTRSSAASNGILLSVLEEGALVSTDQVNRRTYLQAHPDFRIILTSNSRDYAGVNMAPDALLDRMITFPMAPFSVETQSGIVALRTGLPSPTATRIVRLVRALRADANRPDTSMRAAILIARVVAARLRTGALPDAHLAQITADVLNGRGDALPADAITRQLAALTPEQSP